MSIISDIRRKHLNKLNNLPQVRGKQFQKGHVTWNAGTKQWVDKKCVLCHALFQIPQSSVKHNRGKYCSKRCFYEAKTKKDVRENVHSLYVQGKKYREIAKQLNLTQGAVSYHLYTYGLCERNGDGIKRVSTRTSLKNIFKDQGIESCEMCGYLRVVEIAHIIQRSKGGQYFLNNCLLLCPNCHHLFDHKLLSDDEKVKLKGISRVAENLNKIWGMI